MKLCILMYSRSHLYMYTKLLKLLTKFCFHALREEKARAQQFAILFGDKQWKFPHAAKSDHYLDFKFLNRSYENCSLLSHLLLHHPLGPQCTVKSSPSNNVGAAYSCLPSVQLQRNSFCNHFWCGSASDNNNATVGYLRCYSGVRVSAFMSLRTLCFINSIQIFTDLSQPLRAL